MKKGVILKRRVKRKKLIDFRNHVYTSGFSLLLFFIRNYKTVFALYQVSAGVWLLHFLGCTAHIINKYKFNYHLKPRIIRHVRGVIFFFSCAVPKNVSTVPMCKSCDVIFCAL